MCGVRDGMGNAVAPSSRPPQHLLYSPTSLTGCERAATSNDPPPLSHPHRDSHGLLAEHEGAAAGATVAKVLLGGRALARLPSPPPHKRSQLSNDAVAHPARQPLTRPAGGGREGGGAGDEDGEQRMAGGGGRGDEGRRRRLRVSAASIAHRLPTPVGQAPTVQGRPSRRPCLEGGGDGISKQRRLVQAGRRAGPYLLFWEGNGCALHPPSGTQDGPSGGDKRSRRKSSG